MDHGGLRSPMAEVGCVSSNGRCKRPRFSPRKSIPYQAVLQDNRDAVGPQDESWEAGVGNCRQV